MIAEELPHPPASSKTTAGGCAPSKKLYFITDLWYKLTGYWKTAPHAVIRRCAAFVNAHPPQPDCAFQNAARLG
jgi:hypothetical protein